MIKQIIIKDITINWKRKKLIVNREENVYVFKFRRINSWFKRDCIVSREEKKKRRKEGNKTDYRFAVGKKFVFPPRLPMIHTFVQELLISPNKFDAIKKTRDKNVERRKKSGRRRRSEATLLLRFRPAVCLASWIIHLVYYLRGENWNLLHFNTIVHRFDDKNSVFTPCEQPRNSIAFTN